ncbi:ABC-type sugar transport system permease subunit [Paenibacillus rhizosphaerae]|uniref:ABC-type sugar transport system permease subunit n=1 Tax=Paenibacillus rhizosphaerae TaxID=297318 RepID=A0A839TPT4_9BACL|nr:sugar ABC transporter permease [Paenibacillus rhizosphaerae]MBB3128523.1 ABC-type sugar transport system permease subunit [Paenibacillus rhizosphaerae]
MIKRSRLVRWKGWLFILPGLLFHIFAVTIPAMLSLYLPFTEWNGISMPKFIGIENFVEAFQDRIVGVAFLNNVKWMLFWVTIPIIFAFGLAYLLSKIKRGQTAYQSIFFSTSIITVTVAGQIWFWLYNPFSGVNFYLDKAGLGFLEWPGLTIPSFALVSVLIADMWRGFGGNVIWLLAALTQNDKSIEEAAKLDGAGRFRILWNIVLPQIRPTLVVVTLLTALGAFGAFEMVYVMTGGGPAHATETLSTYYYSLSTRGQRAGYGSAIALFQMFIAFILIAVYAYLKKKKGWDV